MSMHQPHRLTKGTLVECLLERIERQVAAQRVRCPPADNPSRERVDQERHVHEPAPRRDVGQVGDPKLVRPCRPELPRPRT